MSNNLVDPNRRVSWLCMRQSQCTQMHPQDIEPVTRAESSPTAVRTRQVIGCNTMCPMQQGSQTPLHGRKRVGCMKYHCMPAWPPAPHTHSIRAASVQLECPACERLIMLKGPFPPYASEALSCRRSLPPPASRAEARRVSEDCEGGGREGRGRGGAHHVRHLQAGWAHACQASSERCAGHVVGGCTCAIASCSKEYVIGRQHRRERMTSLSFDI